MKKLFSGCFLLISWFSVSGNELLRGDGINFIENKGQVIDVNGQSRPDILFTGEILAAKVYLRQRGLSYVLTKYDGFEENDSDSSHLKEMLRQEESVGPTKEMQTVKLHRIDLDFVNANLNTAILKKDEVEGYTNYYYAHCPNGITNVKGYNNIVFQNIYKNIDIVYYGGKEKGLKYDIVIRPGGNYKEIKMQYSGADAVFLEEGKLIIESSLGQMVEHMPKVYQNINGKIVDIEANYELSGTTLSFKLSGYNAGFPIIIDPWITYYGGNGVEFSSGIAIDGAGDCLITGSVLGGNFPVSTGAFQINSAGRYDSDGFVLKFNGNGIRLWATYIGGNSNEHPESIVADGLNNIVVCGGTMSSNFPVSRGCFQANLLSGYDAFISKFNSNGFLQWSTFYGGNSGETAMAVTSDQMNNLFICGRTGSSNFPVSSNCFQSIISSSGGDDAFILKLDANGNPLWSTYYGGNGVDVAFDITADNSNNLIVSGWTTSPNFPVTPGCFQSQLKQWADGFIVKFNTIGNQLWSTYCGGSASDYCENVRTDSFGNVIVCGITNSHDFPVTSRSYQPFFMGGLDNFLLKFNSAGAILWGTYQGSTGWEGFPSLAIDHNNDIYILSEWEDATGTIPSFDCAYQANFGGREDQYIVKFNNNGEYICGTYLGGPAEDDLDNGGGLACFGEFVYFTTLTTGPGYPVTSAAFQNSFSGLTDLIIGKFCGKSCGAYSKFDISMSSSINQSCSGISVNYLCSSSPCDTAGVNYLWQFSGATPFTSTDKSPNGIIYQGPGTYPVKLTIQTPCGKEVLMQQIAIVGTPASVKITGTPVVCPGTAAMLTVTGAITASWSPVVGISNPNSSSVVANPPVSTTYTVSGISIDGCQYSLPVTVSVSQLNMNVSPDTSICYGQSVNISAFAAGGISYLWSPSNGINNINNSTVTVNPSATTDYTIFVTDIYGCTLDRRIEVRVNPLPIISLSSDNNICSGRSILLTASGPYSYSWLPGASLSSSTGNNVMATPLITTTYTVVANIIETGCKDSGFVKINVDPLPAPEISVIPYCGYYRLSCYQKGCIYSWSTNETDSEIYVDIPGSYWVRTTLNSCSTVDTLRVTDVPDFPVVWFPNTFTPNNDGLNDVFTGYGENITEFNLQVFNRWGELIFQTDNMKDGWDGKLDGELVKLDVYVYIADIKTNCDNSNAIHKVGHVLVGK